jgi:hypothetical protein
MVGDATAMNACAYVVGPRNGPAATLLSLAPRLGFDTVLPFSGVALAERQVLETPLCFFLFAEVPDVRAMGSAAQAIRFSSGRRVRFSPLIYFCGNPSMETLRTCINMGFDDVITPPFATRRIEERLLRQINTALTYYETASYFGPDRRGRLETTAAAQNNRGGGQYRKLEIIRSLASGVNVLSDNLQVVL